MNKPTLVLALVAPSLWLVFQKGCVPDQQISPGVVLLETTSIGQSGSGRHLYDQAISIAIERDKRPRPSGTPNQSLKHASSLLRKAADAVEQDKPSTVLLIRQVISILKHQELPGLMDSEATLVPIVLVPDRAERDMPGEAPAAELTSHYY